MGNIRRNDEENILGTSDQADELLYALNIILEFGDSVEAVLAYSLDTHGGNLSEGQKVRLIIARAVNMALITQTEFEINLRLSSIDAGKLDL